MPENEKLKIKLSELSDMYDIEDDLQEGMRHVDDKKQTKDEQHETEVDVLIDEEDQKIEEESLEW